MCMTLPDIQGIQQTQPSWGLSFNDNNGTVNDTAVVLIYGAAMAQEVEHVLHYQRVCFWPVRQCAMYGEFSLVCYQC